MRSVFNPSHRAKIAGRLAALRPDSPRRWGRMSSHQAVCHLADSLRATLGERPIEARPPTLQRRLQRFVAFTLPVPWPKGVPTSAAVDAERGGTQPEEFEADVDELMGLLDRFVATDGALAPHYAWGAMSRGEWGRYAYRHLDHHLRQFGT